MPTGRARASLLSSCWPCAVAVVAGVLAQPAHATDRTAYVVNQLTAWNAGLGASVRNEKYTAMEADRFSFYRGSNHLFWKDHGTSAALSPYGNVGQTRIWLQGDTH